MPRSPPRSACCGTRQRPLRRMPRSCRGCRKPTPWPTSRKPRWRPSRAYQMLTPLLIAAPDSYELNLTRTVALARQHRAREAFDALTILRSLAPDPVGVRAAERVVRAELASSAEPRVSVYSDSDR